MNQILQKTLVALSISLAGCAHNLPSPNDPKIKKPTLFMSGSDRLILKIQNENAKQYAYQQSLVESRNLKVGKSKTTINEFIDYVNSTEVNQLQSSKIRELLYVIDCIDCFQQDYKFLTYRDVIGCSDSYSDKCTYLLYKKTLKEEYFYLPKLSLPFSNVQINDVNAQIAATTEEVDRTYLQRKLESMLTNNNLFDTFKSEIETKNLLIRSQYIIHKNDDGSTNYRYDKSLIKALESVNNVLDSKYTPLIVDIDSGRTKAETDLAADNENDAVVAQNQAHLTCIRSNKYNAYLVGNKIVSNYKRLNAANQMLNEDHAVGKIAGVSNLSVRYQAGSQINDITNEIPVLFDRYRSYGGISLSPQSIKPTLNPCD